MESQSLTTPPTTRLYLEDDHCFSADAVVAAVCDDALAFDRTCFYPGGGGQPPDQGRATLDNGDVLEIVGARADAEGIVWHVSDSAPARALVGCHAHLALDRQRRLALMRYHTVLHVLNTTALQQYGGWITGVQMSTDYSRIDFKLDGFSAALCTELEARVNAVLQEDRALRSYFLPEEEFRQRSDLLRTLDVKPPVVDGRVRVVEIVGFDAQACGGTHVASTAAVGRLTIFRTENKGKNNKRLYLRLDQPAGTPQ